MSPGEEGAGPWDRLTGLHLGPQAHTQPWKRAPCERHALSPEQRLSTPGTSGPWGPLTEQAGCGVPPEQGSPRPSHLTEAEQGGERGGHGVPSLRSRLWGWRRPGCPPDRQTTGCWQSEAGFSHQGRHISVPTERRTVPPRKPGICLHGRAGSQPRDFLRRPFQMRKARLLPSASLASPRLASGSASSSARPSAGPRGVLTVAGVMRPWRCFGEGSDPQRQVLFLNWRMVTLQCGAGFCHTSAWIGRMCHRPSRPIPPL